MVASRSPGVYIEEVFPQPSVTLLTGVPGFVGLFSAKSDKNSAIKLPAPNEPLVLNRQQEFTDKFDNPKGYLAEAVIGFFKNGGSRCYVVRADPDPGKEPMIALMEAIDALAVLTDVDLVVVPDAMTLTEPGMIKKVQKAAIDHCEKHGNRLAILDALPSSNEESLKQHKDHLRAGEGANNAVLYYPWVRVTGISPENLPEKFVPPCGHIAGIFARSDRERGVFKAPANEEILGAIALEISIDNSTQGRLNDEGINCLRAFPGRGIRVWGARTLSQDPNWRYINVRRLFLTLKRWIDLNMGWATFELNTPPLWNRIQRELSTYLIQLWRNGALKGEVPEQAFYVKCDAATNPPENREYGKVVTEIGLAPSFPAEFIVVQITLQANTAEAS